MGAEEDGGGAPRTGRRGDRVGDPVFQKENESSQIVHSLSVAGFVSIFSPSAFLHTTFTSILA